MHKNNNGLIMYSWYFAVDAWPGSCDLRGTARRGEFDSQDHDAYTITFAMREVPSVAGRWNTQGKSKRGWVGEMRGKGWQMREG